MTDDYEHTLSLFKLISMKETGVVELMKTFELSWQERRKACIKEDKDRQKAVLTDSARMQKQTQSKLQTEVESLRAALAATKVNDKEESRLSTETAKLRKENHKLHVSMSYYNKPKEMMMDKIQELEANLHDVRRKNAALMEQNRRLAKRRPGRHGSRTEFDAPADVVKMGGTVGLDSGPLRSPRTILTLDIPLDASPQQSSTKKNPRVAKRSIIQGENLDAPDAFPIRPSPRTGLFCPNS
jgi:hypothetical protein